MRRMPLPLLLAALLALSGAGPVAGRLPPPGRGQSLNEYESCSDETKHGFKKLKCYTDEILATTPRLIDVPPALCEAEGLVVDELLADCHLVGQAVGERAFQLALGVIKEPGKVEREGCNSVLCSVDDQFTDDQLLKAGATALEACDGAMCDKSCIHGVMIGFVGAAKSSIKTAYMQELIVGLCEKSVGGVRLVPSVSVDACAKGAGLGIQRSGVTTVEGANGLCKIGSITLTRACQEGVMTEYVWGHMRALDLDEGVQTSHVATLCDRFKEQDLQWSTGEEKRCVETVGRGLMFLSRPRVERAGQLCRALKNPVLGLTCEAGARDEHRVFSAIDRLMYRERCMRYRELARREMEEAHGA